MGERRNFGRVKKGQAEESSREEQAEHENERGSGSNSMRVIGLRRAACNDCHGNTTG